MADKDKLRFLTGQEANLKDKTLVRGQVYFAISSDTDSGKIYFDAPIDNNTTKRILMSSDHAKTADKATSADRATADSNGRKFTETYVSEIKLDNAGTTILYKYPDITKWKELKPKFLPLTGGTITGELYADSITAGDLLVNGSARFVNTILGNIETANQWKTARGFQIADSDAAHTSVSVNVNGSGNVVLKLPSTIKASLQGNADTATKATNDSNNKKITDEYLHRVSNTSSTLNQFSGAPKYLLGIESFTDGGEVKWQSVDSVKVGSASGADKWNTARNFQVSDSDAAHTGIAVSVNGSKAIVLPLPATIKATLEGNASSANKVNHKYTLTLGKTKQTAFDGSADVSITITPESIGALSKDEASAGAAKWSTARMFYVADADASNTGTGVSVDGSKDITLKLPSTIKGNLKGNADTATTAINADKLDGYHRAGLYSSPGEWITANGYTKTITVNGNADTYYPVVISTTTEKSALNYISVWKNLGTKTATYPGNHSNGTSSMWLIYEGRNWYWDGNGGYLKCWYYSMPYATLCAKAEQASNGVGALVIYLRGGGTEYNISTTYNSTVTVYYEATNLGTTTYPVNVTPTITIENGGRLSSTYLGYGNVPTADAWKTACNFAITDNDASHTGPIVSVNGSTSVTLQLPATIKASITGHASKDLPLTGGTMTGNIHFANNIGITAAMGGGSDGWGIIGTGTNDNSRLKIYVTDNGTTDWIDFEFRDYSGTTYTPLSMTGNQVLFASNIRPTANNTYSLGTNDYKWSSIYATTFYGALSGTASHATSDIRGNAIINTYLTNVYAKSDDSSYLYKQVGPSSERSAELIGRYTPLDSDGLINMKYIPAAALERVVVVANQTAQYALTTANVQLGDVVKRNDTGQLYFVVDTNNLGNAGGYLQFTAGTATNVNWSGILNRPNIVGSATGNAIVPNAANTEFTVYQVNGNGTSTSYVIKPNFLSKTGGTITGELYIDGGTTLASLLVNGDARFVNTIQGSISGNAGSATKWATAKAFYIADAEAKHTSSPQVNIDGSQSSYTLKLPSTIKATLEGNADTATKLTNLTEADKASSTNTWRRVWFAYDDNVNGRPAYSDTFAYQSSTGTVKATKFQGALVGNATSADKWSTARNFITNLGSESPASVDGSTGPYNLGVTGVLPVSHGGTGVTSIAEIKAGKDSDGNTIKDTYLKRYRNSNTYGSGYTDLNGTMPPFLQAYKNGYPIHIDPEFASGNNDIERYDNANSGKTVIERIDMACGNSTGKVLRIRNTGAGPSPNLGGWYFGDTTAYARQYVCIFRAKVPVGYIINWHSNSCGTNSTTYWVTNRSGTGKWEWYAYFVDNGSANFASTMFFALEGTPGTADKPVDWFLSYANTIIVSYGAYDGLRTRYTDNADRWTTTRTFITALNSESHANVNGTQNVTMGVSGVLPVSHGGTGQTSIANIQAGKDGDGNIITSKYVSIYNSNNIGSSADVTVNDLAKQGSAVGMINAATDNPFGKESWVHVWSQAWNKTVNTSWVSQIALGVDESDGMWYRTKEGTIVGASWTRVIDSNNYNNYAVKKASSSTDNAIVRWDGTDGRRIQNSLLSINDEGLLTLQTGNHIGAKLGSAYITSADANSGEIVLQNGHLRFGSDSWDYNQWAGLKYVHSNKIIYLGLADGTIFHANSGQSGGTLALPGIRYFSINGKIAIDANDGWLRINEGKAFATGVYFGSNVVRTDGQLQVGDSGNKFYANSSGNGYFSSTLGIGGTNTSYKLYVNGTSYINGNTTVNGWLKVQNTTDSKNSQDSNASLAIQGGVSVAKQLSAKTIRIDGSSSDTIGSTTQGCTVHFNKTTNCIEFVFD